MAAQTYSGSCHCGAVAFTVEVDPSTALKCNCSICTKLGAVWAFAPKAKFALTSGEFEQGDYQFNKMKLHHHFCSECGIESYAEGTRARRLADGRHQSSLRRRHRCRQTEPAPVGRAQPIGETSMSVSQADKAKKFRALHEAPGAFVIANPWDGGSARLLAGLGFQALATSSGAKAGVLGKRDGKVTREEALANARMIVEACDLPVSADLEKGFGDGPDAAAETIRQAAGDRPGRRLDRGRERQQGQAAVRHRGRGPARRRRREGRARAVLSVHPDGARRRFPARQPDLDDVIRRLQAFEAAGADVLMAPGLPDLAAVKKVCGSLSKPFSFMVGIKGRSFTKADLEAAGVKRISLATSLYRAAMTGLLDAAKEVKEKGTFTYLDHSIPTPDLNAFMKE